MEIKRDVLFVHGGGEGAHEVDEKLAASLRDALGGGWESALDRLVTVGR
jgi:hypothetical protein